MECQIPAQGGRGVLVRSGALGDCVQLALISVYGNVLEAVTLDRAQLPALRGGLDRAARAVDRDLLAALDQRQRQGDRRYREALERNPWLNGTNTVFPNETYIRRPR